MAMLGMDPGKVKSDIIVPFTKCSGDIQQLISQLTTVVNNNLGRGANFAWSGADAMQFKDSWSQHQAKLNEVKNLLDAAINTLNANIQAQQSTSSGGSGNFA